MPTNPLLYLIRHAPTQGNLLRQYIGSTDEPLCPQGIALAKASAHLPKNIERVYCSNLLRARQTADILFPNVGINVLPDLRESDFGDFEGMSYEQLCADSAYSHWISQAGKAPPPNGESRSAFNARCVKAAAAMLNDIFKNNISSAACVTHGGVIMEIMSHFFKAQGDFYFWQANPCHGYILYLDKAAALPAYFKIL